MLSQCQGQRTLFSSESKLVLSYACIPVSPSVPEMEGIIMYILCLWGASFFKDVPLVVEFMYLVFTCMPSESYCRQLRSMLLCLCVMSFGC